MWKWKKTKQFPLVFELSSHCRSHERNPATPNITRCHKWLHLCYDRKKKKKGKCSCTPKNNNGVGCAAPFLRPCDEIRSVFFSLKMFPHPWLLQRWTDSTGRGGKRPRIRLDGSRTSRISPPEFHANLTRSGFCKNGAGWMRMQMRGLPVCFSLLRSPRPPGQDSNRRSVSLWAGCLSATCKLGRKDCSNDALELCTNYAKWPNQLLFPSSAWCACLWMHCPIPPHPPTFFAFSFVGSSRRRDEQLRLFFPPPFVRKKKKMV